MANLNRVLALFVLALAIQPAAGVTVGLPGNTVDCFEDFAVTAAFSISTQNTKAEFFADDYLFATKNPMANSEISARFGMGFGDWDHLKQGAHRAVVRLYNADGKLIDSGEAAFTVAGRRCPVQTTTTLAKPPRLVVNCSSNSDCQDAIAQEPYCVDGVVRQVIQWGECAYPGTSQSVCIDSMDNATVMACPEGTDCIGGNCIPKQTTTSTPSTSSMPVTTTTQAIVTTTSTSTTVSSSSTSTTMIFERTNTKLDRLVDLLEGLIRLFLGD
jgi:hypothetical protein